jgi:FKBP-type peptidyl-prolyl cis-trans isomerase
LEHFLMKFLSLGAAGMAMLVSLSATAQDVVLDTDQQKLSYALGLSIGKSIQQQFGAELTELDAGALSQAISDVILGVEPPLAMDEMQRVITDWQTRKQAEQQALSEAAAVDSAEALAKGHDFLKTNGARAEVTTTDSGLQYEVLTAGTGKMPSASDTVVVHYRGSLIDGTEFDSSYKRDNPATFQVGGVIQGWQEALVLMKAGSKYKLYIPSELGYGERGGGATIGPNEVLVFEVELLEVK